MTFPAADNEIGFDLSDRATERRASFCFEGFMKWFVTRRIEPYQNDARIGTLI